MISLIISIINQLVINVVIKFMPRGRSSVNITGKLAVIGRPVFC